jgi:hypothetical protein
MYTYTFYEEKHGHRETTAQVADQTFNAMCRTLVSVVIYPLSRPLLSCPRHSTTRLLPTTAT